MTPTPKICLAVLASGAGSNLQAILDACRTPLLERAQVELVFSNKEDAYALGRAAKAGIETLFLDPKKFDSRTEFYEEVTAELEKRRIELILLAGYLLKLEPNIVQRFRGRILNIHPALLPKFGGAGMYGPNVHQAVIKAGEKESGASVHVVDEEFDHGTVLMQKKVPVLAGDTAQTLAERVLDAEHKLYPEAVAYYIREYLEKGKV